MNTREAELELENMRLREALTWAKSGFSQAAGGFQSQKHLEEHWCVCSEALSTPPDTNALSTIIEKVERATIERCAKHLEFNTHAHSALCVRSITTGQIKPEDLL